jgi:DNA-binding GntR family transcriptional regulator
MRPPRSLTEHIYNELRAELISCALKPGERLRTSELSTRFSVSLSGVREALSRLVSEGLVLADPQRGFRAAAMSREDLLNLTETAMGIEAMCVRSALAAGDKDWEERLVAARDTVMAAPLTTKSEGGRLSASFAKAHQDFHDTLMSACSNARTSQLRRLLHDQSERYRQLCIPLTPNLAELKSGYEEITGAALARDADRVIALIAEQFHRNVERFIEAMESEGALRFWVDEPSAVAARARKPRTKATIG